MPEQTDRDDQGRFSYGNAIWQQRKRLGAPPTFEDAQQLWEACCAYFQWATDNPLYEAKVLTSGDQVSVAKMRAFTQKALCLHLGISDETWRGWRESRKDLKEVVEAVDAVIFTQKFEGAAAGLLNHNLIAREIGLADRQEVSGRNGSPIKTEELSKFEVARRIAFLLREGLREQESENKVDQNNG